LNNKQATAISLNGRQYGDEITMDECNSLRQLGLVVVFGSSDDNMEFRGAIYTETGCFNGGEIFLDKDGLFEDCECECKYSIEAKLKCKYINALWCEPTEPDHDCISWTYDTDIPHETFNIMEGNEIFCIGIVFDIKDL